MAALTIPDLLPTGGGVDFLSRLTVAEQRDDVRLSHRALSSMPVNVPHAAGSYHKQPHAAPSSSSLAVRPPSALKKAKRQKTQKRELTFHPRVVTGGCFAHPENDQRRASTANPMTDITMYSEEEEKYAIERQMTKMHLRSMTRQVDGEMRRKINAVAADEAWKRADELRLELEYHGVVPPDGTGETLQQRQNAAARRCMEQSMVGSDGAPTPPQPREDAPTS